jgi:hypothetical protein
MALSYQRSGLGLSIERVIGENRNLGKAIKPLVQLLLPLGWCKGRAELSRQDQLCLRERFQLATQELLEGKSRRLRLRQQTSFDFGLEV